MWKEFVIKTQRYFDKWWNLLKVLISSLVSILPKILIRLKNNKKSVKSWWRSFIHSWNCNKTTKIDKFSVSFGTFVFAFISWMQKKTQQLNWNLKSYKKWNTYTVNLKKSTFKWDSKRRIHKWHSTQFENSEKIKI